jgi:hypothetical protein
MSVAFSAGVYLLAGAAIVAWLRFGGRLEGGVTLVIAVLFWPAYLTVCLGPKDDTKPADPSLASLAERIRALPVDAVRREEYSRALEKIANGLAAREAELLRLGAVEARLVEMGRSVGTAQVGIVGEERNRIAGAMEQLKADLVRARAQVVSLAVKVEVFAIRAPKESLDSQLESFEEDLDRLLKAQIEVEQLG